MNISSGRKRASGKCPLCKRPQSESFEPFCSKACKDRDLLNWLGEGYALPGPPAHDIPDQDI